MAACDFADRFEAITATQLFGGKGVRNLTLELADMLCIFYSVGDLVVCDCNTWHKWHWFTIIGW